jgi:hypothetical protein
MQTTPDGTLPETTDEATAIHEVARLLADDSLKNPFIESVEASSKPLNSDIGGMDDDKRPTLWKGRPFALEVGLTLSEYRC